MNCKRLFAMILACILVVNLAACGGPEPTTPPTAAPTAPPTQPPTLPPTEPPTQAPTEPDPVDLYNQAVTSLSDKTDFVFTVQGNRTLTVSGESYKEKFQQDITYVGYGTETFQAAVKETVDQAGYVTEYVEQFQDGMLYVTIDATNQFRGEMTAEDYISRYAPPVMLDAALYNTVNHTDGTITFTDAIAGESWIVPEFAELVEATGSVTLDGNSRVTSTQYDVTYAIGGNEIHYQFTANYASAEKAAVTAVADPDSFTKLDYVDAPRILETVSGYMMQANTAHALTTTTVDSIFSQAGGVLRNEVLTINSWGTGVEYTADVDTSIYVMSINGEEKQEMVEHFSNGTFTTSINGSEPQKNPAIKASTVKNYVAQALVSNIPDHSAMTNATAEDLGTLYYLELTFTEDIPAGICQYICQMFWNDGDFLNNLASSYETETMEYYLAVDKYTGLPTAVGYNYAGNHVIEGYPYPLTQQVDQAFNLCSTDAYRNLTDDVITPDEPDEKASPLFYHVTGDKGQELWLLGTIHVGDARTSYLPQEIYDAFDAADALAVEFNSEAFNEELENNEELSSQVSDSYFYSDGTTTADHVEDEELYEYALKLLKATGNYNMNMPYAKAYLWGNSIENYLLDQFHALSSQQGVDNQLIWRAEDQEKPIYDVESGLFQTQMLFGFSDPLQEMLLLESVTMDPLEYASGTRELFEMWCAGDEATLIAYLTEEEDLSELTDEELKLLEEYNNAMGTDRNDDMLDVAIGYLESGEVVFYAVGLAHLLAEDGLVNTLRDAGYTVELVTYK